ncbi:MAG: hypothetical protein JNK04_10245 [Myxococcales bacterium]|nr:hypothetical protein [Myxococcales bacterium]
MTTQRSLSIALLLFASSTPALANAQPAPPPDPPPGGQPVAQPLPPQAPPDAPTPPAPGAPVQPPPGAPPNAVPAPPGAPPAWVPGQPPPQWQPPNGPEGVVVMPPGYLEQPGRWPRRLPVQEKGDPAPLGYHVSKEPRRALWATGTAIFVAGHAITGLVAGAMIAGGGEEHDALLYIPVLGPIIWAPVESPLDTSDGRGLFAGMSLVTAAQGVGLALLISGFVFKQPVFYRNDVDAKLEEPAIRPTFSFGPGGVQGGFTF